MLIHNQHESKNQYVLIINMLTISHMQIWLMRTQVKNSTVKRTLYRLPSKHFKGLR